MEEKDKMQEETSTPKKEKEKSLFEVAREIEEQQRREELRIEAEQQEAAQRIAEEQRRTYEKQLREERIELMRLKQGVIDESETIYEEKQEEKKYTIWQRISNYFYHNKWWMGFAAFFLCLGGFLVYQTVTRVRADVVVLLVSENESFNAMCAENISTILEGYAEDSNGDGKVTVDVYYIPASENASTQSAYTGDSSKLFAEFQMGDSLLVISDADADPYIVADQNLADLEADFGQYTQTDGVRFYLADTKFAEAVDWVEELDEDIYIGIRRVKVGAPYEKEMQKNYEAAYPVLQQFIEEYGTLEEAAPEETAE